MSTKSAASSPVFVKGATSEAVAIWCSCGGSKGDLRALLAQRMDCERLGCAYYRGVSPAAIRADLERGFEAYAHGRARGRHRRWREAEAPQGELF